MALKLALQGAEERNYNKHCLWSKLSWHLKLLAKDLLSAQGNFMQTYLEFGRISVIIPMSFVCSSIATPNADDDLPSAFLTPGKPYLYSLVRLRSTVRGRPAWPDSGWRWILSADNLDCTRSGPLSQRRTLNRSVCRSEALARNCTGCRWYEAPLEKKMSTIKWREM